MSKSLQYLPLAALAVALLLPPTAWALAPNAVAESTDARAEQIGSVITAEMERLKVPGASIAVFDDYSIVWTQGFGRLSASDDKNVTPETRFQAASISKPITALAALRLVEQGRLDLDKPVNEQLKSWQIPAGNIFSRVPIKLRHLLSHWSGLSVHGFVGYKQGETVPTLLQVLDGAPPANSAAIAPFMRPEYKMSYSGGGYCVVQQLLIDTSGEPFPEFMQQTVLGPLKMTHSSYQQPLPESDVSTAATGHRPNGKAIDGDCYVYPEMAAAGLWTTPSDLCRAAIDVSQSYRGQSGHLLTPEMARKMLTLQNDRFGLGFVVKGEGRSLQFEHGGANEGFRCVLVAYPNTGQGVAIMTNNDTGGEIFKPTLAKLAELYDWPATDDDPAQ